MKYGGCGSICRWLMLLYFWVMEVVGIKGGFIKNYGRKCWEWGGLGNKILESFIML